MLALLMAPAREGAPAAVDVSSSLHKNSDGDGKTKKKWVYTPISPTRPPPPMRVLVLAVLAFCPIIE
jgi:hypothetical protein